MHDPNLSDQQVDHLVDLLLNGSRLRPGRHIGRNLYLTWPGDEPERDRSQYVGVTDSAALTTFICETVNSALDRPGGTPSMNRFGQ